jgi:hypothetical protein
VDNVCLPKISFLQSNPLTDNNIFKYIGTHGGSGESNTKFYFGDFNGDGMTDYVYHNTSYNDGKFRINLADGTGSFKYIGTHGGSGDLNFPSLYDVL